MLPAHNRYQQLRQEILFAATSPRLAPAPLHVAERQYVSLTVTERLVQCIWFDQRLVVDNLHTVDGQPLRVLSPGWWNVEAGPDFRNATIQIGAAPELTGDVEIHLRPSEWHQHGHDADPRYNNVILHVALWPEDGYAAVRTQSGRSVPQLVLEEQLAAPLEQLQDEIDLDSYPHNAGHRTGRCETHLKRLPVALIRELLSAAGDERFAEKVRKFVRWIQQRGAAQAFYEGWMEALGYKANKTAFRMLAQRVPLIEATALGERLPAVMFGVANFLPTQAASGLARRLWQIWWQVRPEYEDRQLPAGTWQLHGVRPANHPHRRLGIAIALLRRHPQLLDNVIGAVHSDGDPAKLFLDVRDSYWATHYTLGGREQTHALALLGQARVREIVSNVVLPFVAAHAQLTGDTALQVKAATRFAALPPAPPNSLLRLAGKRLFGKPTAAGVVKTSRQQQGLIQLFEDFCLSDKSACQQCRFPELIQRWYASP